MAEYWKSTPKYWCKFCSEYVRDTKFERAKHEATGRHQGNIQRSLKSLHRAQENEQREQARAQAEVLRLNKLVRSNVSTSMTSVATGSGGPPPTHVKRPEKKATLEDRKRQWEQIAAMGVALPEVARSDLGLAGEWKTVSEEVVGEVNDDGEFKAICLNKGVRKRKVDEEEEELIAAGEVITRKKGWGQTYKSFPGSKNLGDSLDSLLQKPSHGTEATQMIKEEDNEGDNVKVEEDADRESNGLQNIPTQEEAKETAVSLKQEKDSTSVTTVVFKKRKKVIK